MTSSGPDGLAPTIHTARLRLRAPMLGDFEAACQLWAHPDVYRYTGGSPRSREEVWRRLLANAGTWALLGYGSWVVEQRSDGAYLVGSTWAPMTAIGAPSARLATVRDSGWAFAIRPGVVAIVGGQTALNGTLAHDGATYEASASAWKAIPSWPSNEDHRNGIGVWTGSEFVLWSGRSGGAPTTTGERIAF